MTKIGGWSRFWYFAESELFGSINFQFCLCETSSFRCCTAGRGWFYQRDNKIILTQFIHTVL